MPWESPSCPGGGVVASNRDDSLVAVAVFCHSYTTCFKSLTSLLASCLLISIRLDVAENLRHFLILMSMLKRFMLSLLVILCLCVCVCAGLVQISSRKSSWFLPSWGTKLPVSGLVKLELALTSQVCLLQFSNYVSTYNSLFQSLLSG